MIVKRQGCANCKHTSATEIESEASKRQNHFLEKPLDSFGNTSWLMLSISLVAIMVVDEVLVSLTESRTARSSLVLFGSLFHFSTFAIDLSSFELLPLESSWAKLSSQRSARTSKELVSYLLER